MAKSKNTKTEATQEETPQRVRNKIDYRIRYVNSAGGRVSMETCFPTPASGHAAIALLEELLTASIINVTMDDLTLYSENPA